MGTELKIVTPETSEIERQGGDMVTSANSLVVVSDEGFVQGGNMLSTIKSVSKVIDNEFAEPVKKAHEAHKAMVALRDRALAPFKQAEAIIKGKLARYQADQQEKRRVEAERLAAEARKKAEEEQMKAAEKAMDSGDLAKAEQLLNAPVVPAVTQAITAEAPKLAGISFREDFDFVVEDVDAIPREYMTPDVQMIRRVVKAQGKVCRIPGIRVIAKQVVAAK